MQECKHPAVQSTKLRVEYEGLLDFLRIEAKETKNMTILDEMAYNSKLLYIAIQHEDIAYNNQQGSKHKKQKKSCN